MQELEVATVGGAGTNAGTGQRPLARYELRGLLGEGGGGSVHEVWDTRIQRCVALKRIALHGDADDWLREARLAAQIEHPSFATLHDVFVAEGYGHLVMERIIGRTLARVVADGPVAPALATRWIMEAAEGLEAAHARRIVHGDIKPANLMVDESGRVRIVDFGVARAIDRLATLGTGDAPPAAGTLAYMAPEQLLGEPAGVKTDIYGLGLVLAEMLTGRRGFAGTQALRLAHDKLQCTLRFATDVDPDLAALAQRMTARHPCDRPASMAEVAARLRALHTRSPRPMPRWRRSTVAAAGGVALGATLALATLWHPHSEPPAPVRLQEAAALLKRFHSPSALEDAIKLLTSVLRDKPQDAGAAAYLSLAYALKYASDAQDEQWLVKAGVAARQAIAADDQLALASTAQAWVDELHGRATQAESGYQRALRLDPTELYAANGYAELLKQQRRFAEAEAVLGDALKRHPGDAMLLAAQGSLRYETGDYAAAQHAFELALAAEPGRVTTYASLGATLMQQQRPDDALSALQKGLRIQPDSFLYGNLGNILYDLGRFADAADAFRHAVSDRHGRPNNYLSWANLADALRWIPGQEDQARSNYRRALSLLAPLLARDPQDATRLSRAALYAARSGEPTRARAWSEAALRQAPNAPEVLFRALVVAELCGDREQAIQLLGRARAAGYPSQSIEREPDLLALRRDAHYHQLMSTTHKP